MDAGHAGLRPRHHCHRGTTMRTPLPSGDNDADRCHRGTTMPSRDNVLKELFVTTRGLRLWSDQPNNADLRGNVVIQPVIGKEPATTSAQVVAVLTYTIESDEWRGRMEHSADGGTHGAVAVCHERRRHHHRVTTMQRFNELWNQPWCATTTTDGTDRRTYGLTCVSRHSRYC
jgi:hypothetical protein